VNFTGESCLEYSIRRRRARARQGKLLWYVGCTQDKHPRFPRAALTKGFLKPKMENSKQSLPRILIVDDEKAVRGLLTEVLAEKYECDAAESGEAALELIKAAGYSVVISDVEMSGLSGVEMVPLIHDLSPNTVILLITGSLSQEYAARSKSAGAFDLITKPFDLDFIERAVRLAHERHLALRDRSLPAAPRHLKFVRIAGRN